MARDDTSPALQRLPHETQAAQTPRQWLVAHPFPYVSRPVTLRHGSTRYHTYARAYMHTAIDARHATCYRGAPLPHVPAPPGGSKVNPLSRAPSPVHSAAVTGPIRLRHSSRSLASLFTLYTLSFRLSRPAYHAAFLYTPLFVIRLLFLSRHTLATSS